MIGLAMGLAIASALVFGALALMSDRKRGALIAQLGSVVAAAAIFVAIGLGDGTGWARTVSAFGTALFAATLAGMGYHLYLGRFDDVWRARGVFTLVFLAMAAAFGLVYLSLI